MLNCIDRNPVPRGTRNHPHEALLNSGLTLADSGIQVDLEIALGGIPTKDQPHGLRQLGQRGVETSGDVIDHSFASPTKICQALLLGAGILLF